jgi:hypothetical protein
VFFRPMGGTTKFGYNFFEVTYYNLVVYLLVFPRMIKGLMRTVAGKLEDSTINRSHKGKTLTMDSHPKCFYLPCTQVHGSGGDRQKCNKQKGRTNF